MSTLDNYLKSRDEVYYILKYKTITDEQRERLNSIQNLTNYEILEYSIAMNKWSEKLKKEFKRRKKGE